MGYKKPHPDFGRGTSKYRWGDTMVKRRGKDRENSRNGEIPYFFLLCAGFSLYPDA